MAVTVRESCLRGMVALLEAMTDGQPAADPYSVTWRVVNRSDLDNVPKGTKYACSVSEITETVLPETYPHTNKLLSVSIEWEQLIDKNEVPSTEFNRVLGEIQRKIGEDRTLGGNAIDTVETGSEQDIDFEGSKAIGGSVFFDIRYRHNVNDPRSVV